MSPLIRALQTATTIFDCVDGDLKIRITPSAREGWWEASENRGRLAAGLRAGTATGAAGEDQKWPALTELPSHHRICGLESVETPTPFVYEPEQEAALVAQLGPEFAAYQGSGPFGSCFVATLAALEREIMESDANVMAVVCHWGVVRAMTDVSDPPNCCVIRTSWRLDGDTGPVSYTHLMLPTICSV